MLFDPQTCFFWETRWSPGTVEPMRQIYETELVYVSQGAYTLQIDQEQHRMKRGMVALIPPARWHESRCETAAVVVRHCIHFTWLPEGSRPKWQVQSLVGQPFDAALVSPVPDAIARALPVIRTVDRDLQHLLDLAINSLRRNQALGHYVLWPILRMLLMEAKGMQANRRPGRPRSTAAEVVRDYIDSHYMEPHGYDVYTKKTGLPASHLCQMFKRRYGSTPRAYLNDLRLSQAYRMLRMGTYTQVQDVALAVGFRDANYFARSFRQRFGMPPSEVLAADGHDYPPA